MTEHCGLDPRQIRDLVVRPALAALGPAASTLAGEQLVMGTGAQESGFRFLKQLGSGPALGIFQMEPATYRDIWKNWLPAHPELRAVLQEMVSCALPEPATMVWDLRFAAAMCRVFYLRVSLPLPPADDIVALAAYWKRYYNTELGRGRPAEFVNNWARSCAALYAADTD